MSNPKKPQNQAIEPDKSASETSDSATMDASVEDTQSHEVDSGNKKPEQIDHGRRDMLAKLFALGITFTAPMMQPSDARADYNPYLDKLAPVLDAPYKGRELPPDIMPQKEKILLNKSMEVFWRTYLHSDFWHTLTTKAPAVQKILEIAMAKENRAKLWYRGDVDGVMTIQSRTKGDPKINKDDLKGIFIPSEMDLTDISIEISYGKITKVNGVKINHSSITKYDDSWKIWNKRIERISPKIALMNQFVGTPTASTIPPITDVEIGWYYQYSFEWPHRFYRLLELKGDLTEDEARLKKSLKHLLATHPKDEADFIKSSESSDPATQVDPSAPIPDPPSEKGEDQNTSPQSDEAPTTQPDANQATAVKEVQLIVWRRKQDESTNSATGEKTIQQKTPDNMVELVKFDDIARRAFAGISQDGFTMMWKNGKWVRSDTSAMPFVPKGR